ncbi:myo-inositol 2-dehydrogenase [Jatrophihabitans sp. GAS493]|uniref:Gfo/Idh/MocA family protein n=1 Tax=Jatrophihabitans sp. GAS493 TaxID=1907575 RepID=UPI000BB84015|nr:Gfo/Idh/MocA family oxidoreductase [Jatrophihabitans sp. GAS493]SOD73712.1 myo-inositol 2-dehydrogenase [Jatrophihabitans sp. GAS493]
MTVRTGVIGVGIMGAEHARLLTEVVSGSEVSAVFDVDQGRASQVAGGSGARLFDDPMVLIKDESVDAVLIASSDATHEQFVLACLAVGKPVLCEKPLAPDVAGCERILDTEIELGRQLASVGFMRRYDPGYLALKAEASELGEALLLRCIHRSASAPRNQPSSMLISGSAVHEIDIARWLLDDEPTQITVHRPRASSLSGSTQDPLLIVILTAGGVAIDIDVFVNAQYGYDVRCELVGELGAVELDAPAATRRRLSAATSRTLPPDWRPRFAEAYRRELQSWIDGNGSDKAPEPSPYLPATAWDGYVATATAEAGIRALESGQTQQIILREKPELYR